MLTVLVVLAANPCVLGQGPRVLDDFATLDGWKVITAEGVNAKIAPDVGPDGSPCMRLDFEFVTGGGYCLAQKKFPLDLPNDYEFAFECRAAPGTASNNLEFKLLDESGESVWWVNRQAEQFPMAWRRFVNKRRQIQFAWGPAAGAAIKRLGAIEFGIASSSGGKGSVFFDNLTLRTIPPKSEHPPAPNVTASASEDGQGPARVLDGDRSTAWRSGPLPAGGLASLTIDLGESRELGGLVIDWAQGGQPESFELLWSDDASMWQAFRGAKGPLPERSYVATPDLEARFLRLDMKAGELARALSVTEVSLKEPAFGASGNALYAAMAAEAPRGRYPRYFANQQCFWTVLGVAGDEKEALLNVDGALEVDKRSFSLEPFIYDGEPGRGRLITWADGASMAELDQGYLPIPSVTRAAEGLELKITAFGAGEGDSATLYAMYAIRNTRNVRATGSLFIALRPFQVNPPAQWLNIQGGVARVPAIRCIGPDLAVGSRRVAMLTPPTALGAASFDQGDISTFLARGVVPPSSSASDEQDLASAAAQFAFALEPGQSRTVLAAVPWRKGFELDAPIDRDVRPTFLPAIGSDATASFNAVLGKTRAWWVKELNRVDFDLPPKAAHLWEVARSQLAYILINRDGPAIQPGSRCYERSWARDGSMTSAALLEFGRPEEVRAWIEWFASNQFPSGKVPCVVDARGPDPVPENDSHGQLIMAIANDYRYSGDSEFLRRMLPHVKAAVGYIEKIRAERMTADYADPNGAKTKQEPGKPPVPLHAFYGLVPESISHEGYSAKPMHSYWDDFFILRGLKDAAFIAQMVGERELAARWGALRDDFRATLLASLDASMAAHGIDYLPGCAELGDFDATSTTVALWPGGEAERLPRTALRRTFDKYWEFFLQRRDDTSFAWVDYTPYENRVVGSFLRLGQKQRAHEALAFFMADQRPAGWNQWSEVVYRDPTTAKFVGDTPHTWVGSDFLNSFRAMFVQEREDDGGDALVLLAGVPESWVLAAGERGMGFSGLPTPWGKVSCRIVTDGKALQIRLEGDLRRVPGGIVVMNPMDKPIRSATIGGKDVGVGGGAEIRVESLPAEILLQY